jgi:hypothetical protein
MYNLHHEYNYAMVDASESGNILLMQWLAANGSAVYDVRVFYRACYSGHLHVVQWLISQGARWNNTQLDEALREVMLYQSTPPKTQCFIIRYLLLLGANYRLLRPYYRDMVSRLYFLLGSTDKSSSIYRWISHNLSERQLIPLIFTFLEHVRPLH